jgi:hypothetical protein
VSVQSHFLLTGTHALIESIFSIASILVKECGRIGRGYD